jgi:hypothetical protein
MALSALAAQPDTRTGTPHICFTVFTLATYVSGQRKGEQDLRDSFLRRQERLETYLARIDYTAPLNVEPNVCVAQKTR